MASLSCRGDRTLISNSVNGFITSRIVTDLNNNETDFVLNEIERNMLTRLNILYLIHREKFCKNSYEVIQHLFLSYWSRRFIYRTSR